MHGVSPDYLNVLQSHVSVLRRKLSEERREQEHLQSAIDADSSEAECLRARIDEIQKATNVERDILKERQAHAESGRVAAEACRKEIVDRKFQIQKLREELEQAEKTSDREVADGVQRGKCSLEEEQHKHLAALDSQRHKRKAEVESAEAEVSSLKLESIAEENKAARLIRRSAAAQLCSAWETCRHRCALKAEEQKVADVARDLEKQREEKKEACRVQLEEAAKYAAASRRDAAELRETKEKKAKKKAKALRAKIDDAKQTLSQLEREAAEREAMEERKRRAEFLAAAKLSVARAEALREADQVSPATLRKVAGHRALHAEFTVLGALREIDKNISEIDRVRV